MNGKFVTYLSCLIMTMFAMSLTVISPLIMEIAGTFSLNVAQSGILFTANFIGFVIFVLTGGVLSDCFGKKAVLNVSAVGLTLSLLAFALAPDFNVLCAVAIIMGGFGGVVESIISALISDINSEKPEFYINLSQVFFGIGALVGPAGAGLMVSGGIGWRACYLALGAFSFVLTVIFLFSKVPSSIGIKHEQRQEGMAGSARGSGMVLSLFKDTGFILLCLAMLFYTGAEVGGWGWMCTFLNKEMGFSVQKSGFAVALFWAAMTVGRIFCGVLTLRLKTVRIITVLAFLSAVFTLLSAFVKVEAGVWLVVAAMGLSYSSQFPLIIAYGGSRIKAPSGIVFSLLVAGGGVGSMFVPYIMGFVGDISSMGVAMLVPAVLLFLVSVIFVYFWRKE